MKSLYALCVLYLLFLPLEIAALPSKVIEIVPPAEASVVSAQSTPISETVAIPSLLRVGRTLAKLHGSRPYWPGPQIDPKNVPADLIDTIIPYLIACESRGDTNASDTDHVDSNGVVSYGILQFQKWATDWEKPSGLGGSPDNPSDAIQMARWAIANGYLAHWSCAALLNIVKI